MSRNSYSSLKLVHVLSHSESTIYLVCQFVSFTSGTIKRPLSQGLVRLFDTLFIYHSSNKHTLVIALKAPNRVDYLMLGFVISSDLITRCQRWVTLTLLDWKISLPIYGVYDSVRDKNNLRILNFSSLKSQVCFEYTFTQKVFPWI